MLFQSKALFFRLRDRSLWSFGQLAQDGVDHAGGEAVAGLFGQLDAFVDCGAGGDAVQVQQLECAQAECDQDFCIELRMGARQQDLDLMVELNLPAQHAQNECRGQVAVRRGERVDGFAAQQVVGMGVAALDG